MFTLNNQYNNTLKTYSLFLVTTQTIIMKVPRQQRRQSPDIIKLPLIKDRINVNVPLMNGNKNLKLQKIHKQRNIALIDIAKIDKIQKQFTILTKRPQKEQKSPNIMGGSKGVSNPMRESRLLLLKNITPVVVSKKPANSNLLSSLVSYSAMPAKPILIASSNISSSPTKFKKPPSTKKLQNNQLITQYHNGQALQKVDFVKMFIVEELFYYISKLKDKVKEEMTGFCRFYNQNDDQQTMDIVSQVLVRKNDYLMSVFYEKIGLYIFLILGTDTQLQQQASFLLNSLCQYIHKNNLIILDMLIQIVSTQKYPISSQFHVYNTSRFNQDRRKIKHNQDRMTLVAKNNKSLVELIKSILTMCQFDSLKSFVFQILGNQDVEMEDKIREVGTMLQSLDAILTSSVQRQVERPLPPFLPPLEGDKKYTLVLDMDETLIHYRQIQGKQTNSFLIRPFCQQFLDQMFLHYQIVIFTAAVKQYADSILDSIDPQKRISYRLYRQHTRLQDYVSIKDISLINRDLSKSIIVDNIASNFKLQQRNGIAISTWTGEEDDVALGNLIPVLKKLVVEKVNDVRDGLERLSQYMEQQMTNNQQINFDSITLTGL